MTEPIEM